MPSMHMPQRTTPFRVATTLGHTFIFMPGEPVSVPDDCVPLCMQYGAVPVDVADLKVFEERVASEIRSRLTPEQRKALLLETFAKFVEHPEKYREAFTAGGRPHTGWLSRNLNLDQLGVAEVLSAWDEFMAQRKASELS